MKNRIKKGIPTQGIKKKIELIVENAMSQWKKKGQSLKNRNINIQDSKETVLERIRD